MGTSRIPAGGIGSRTSACESPAPLLRSLGYGAEAFRIRRDFLAPGSGAGCLTADIRMPGMSGPELQREPSARGDATLVVFIRRTAAEPNERSIGEE